MVYISVIITHILHITNHAGPSVWAAIYIGTLHLAFVTYSLMHFRNLLFTINTRQWPQPLHLENSLRLPRDLIESRL